MQPTRLPKKKDVALALLEQSTVYVHLDPRSERVHVPIWFKKQPQLVLQIGLNMAVPIPDLQVDDEGLSCTLSFSRTPHFCQIPWSVVFALVGENGRGMVWPDDVPPEVTAQAENQARDKAKAEETQGRLRAVQALPAEEAQAAAGGAPKKRKPRPKKAAAVPAVKAQAEAKPERKPAAKRKRKAEPAPQPSAQSAEAGDSRKPVAKGKRELPPYLRVVK
jgi:stringent starvation protein B